MKKIYETDPYLAPYKEAIEKRHERILEERDKIAMDGSLADGLNNHLYYGLHRDADGAGSSVSGLPMPAGYTS